jgi:hypothetical protein
MDTLTKFAGERYQVMLDSEAGEAGDDGGGAAISTRSGIEILIDLLASLPHEELCRYLLTPAPTTDRQGPR